MLKQAWTVILFSYLGLSACTLGPDFKHPDSPESKTYTQEKLPNRLGKQQLLMGKELPANWWMLYRSPQLSSLIDKALHNNPDLQEAQARLTQALEIAVAKESSLMPTVDAGFDAHRQKISGAQFGSPSNSGSLFSVYNASVNVSYTLDVFGSVRRHIESLMAEADYQRFQLEGTFLTLSSNIVTTAIEEASIREQLKVIEQLIQLKQQQLDIVKQQVKLGGASQAEVLAQQTSLEQERANLPPLQKQLLQTRHRLAVLVGDLPSQQPNAQFTLNDLKLPLQLPVSLPSKLVNQRPDIRGQEALLKAANANIGLITAKMFPDFTITANVATIATHVGDLFIPGSAIWNTGLNLLQPIFHGGENIHQRDAAIAAYQAAAAHYRRTVLNAFENVANVLTALQTDVDAIKTHSDEEKTALASLTLSQQQYKTGAISYLMLLNAQSAYQQSRLALIKAQADQLTDTAALFQALGGGWWQRADLARTLKSQQKKPTSNAWLPFFDWTQP